MENIDPELLPQLLTLKDGEVILPLRTRREEVHKIRALKLSDEEVGKVASLQLYLSDRGFIPENSFTQLFVYCFNLAFTFHRQAAQEEAKQEARA